MTDSGVPGAPLRVAIIGGGIAGLATAALLARGGADVTVLERRDQVGGRAGRWAAQGFTFDTGPSWYFMPEAFEHLFELLGRDIGDHLRLLRLDPSYRVFTEPGKGASRAETLDVLADAEANWRTFEAIEPGAGTAMREYASGATRAYRIALERFLYTTFQRVDRVASPEILRRIPELTRLLATSLSEHIADSVGSPRLRQILGYHAVFLGSSPYRVPALYSLMSHLDLVDGVLYPDGGIYQLIEAIASVAEEEGARILLEAEVVGVDVDPDDAGGLPGRRRGRATGVRLADGRTVVADVVVSAADLHHTETALLDPTWRSYSDSYWSRRTPGISALLAYVGVRGELPELAHHSLFFTRDWSANFDAIFGSRRSARGADMAGGRRVAKGGSGAASPDAPRVPVPASLYLARPSATDPSVAPPGHETLTLLVPFPAEPAIGSAPGELDRMADGYLSQVADWAGIPDLLDRVVLRRTYGPADFANEFFSWRGSALGMEHTLSQSAMFRPAGASRKVSNLLYVGGGTLPGIGLPMCAISAELVVKRLLGDTSAAALAGPLSKGFLAGVAGRNGGSR